MMGYWTTILDRSIYKQETMKRKNGHPIDGDTAFDLARNEIDLETLEKQRQLKLLAAEYFAVLPDQKVI